MLYFDVLVVKLNQTYFFEFILKKILRKKPKKREILDFVLMTWSVLYFVITPGHFGEFVMPLRPHKPSDQYPLKGVGVADLSLFQGHFPPN
jgi:hypothetical protein